MLRTRAETDEEVAAAMSNCPATIWQLFEDPACYTGHAKNKALAVANWATERLSYLLYDKNPKEG